MNAPATVATIQRPVTWGELSDAQRRVRADVALLSKHEHQRTAYMTDGATILGLTFPTAESGSHNGFPCVTFPDASDMDEALLEIAFTITQHMLRERNSLLRALKVDREACCIYFELPACPPEVV